jgi:hypothetical protein
MGLLIKPRKGTNAAKVNKSAPAPRVSRNVSARSLFLCDDERFAHSDKRELSIEVDEIDVLIIVF